MLVNVFYLAKSYEHEHELKNVSKAGKIICEVWWETGLGYSYKTVGDTSKGWIGFL